MGHPRRNISELAALGAPRWPASWDALRFCMDAADSKQRPSGYQVSGGVTTSRLCSHLCDTCLLGKVRLHDRFIIPSSQKLRTQPGQHGETVCQQTTQTVMPGTPDCHQVSKTLVGLGRAAWIPAASFRLSSPWTPCVTSLGLSLLPGLQVRDSPAVRALASEGTEVMCTNPPQHQCKVKIRVFKDSVLKQ